MATRPDPRPTEVALERIAEREPTLHAFAARDAVHALAQAHMAPEGPLRGVPIAVKDVFDTADFPTAYGSSIWAGHRPRADAAAVALARAAGAVVVGKTVTTEFASYTPGATVNPHDALRTPGGSSSGSAAAVAAGMVVAAFGTQTAGSIIRPAAYCGVVGFKPSFGMIPRAGMKPLAESFDTAGTFGRRVQDAAALAAVAAARPDLLRDEMARPTLGICRTDWWAEAEPAQQAAVERAASRLAAAGWRVVELPQPDVALANERQGQAIAWETARAFAWERSWHAEKLSAKFREICARGMAMDAAEHARVWEELARVRAAVADLFSRCDVLLTPSAPGEAPLGLAATGAPTFNRLWSVFGGPCLSLPFGHGAHGMPLGVQLVGRRGEDALLLAAARAAERDMA
jgi:Asp-tRNA(Asn)/Glu-tRNA(Gln) amidotransferase A subunit family amidase